jgi:hypothetical protein
MSIEDLGRLGNLQAYYRAAAMDERNARLERLTWQHVTRVASHIRGDGPIKAPPLAWQGLEDDLRALRKARVELAQNLPITAKLEDVHEFVRLHPGKIGA